MIHDQLKLDDVLFRDLSQSIFLKQFALHYGQVHIENQELPRKGILYSFRRYGFMNDGKEDKELTDRLKTYILKNPDKDDDNLRMKNPPANSNFNPPFQAPDRS